MIAILLIVASIAGAWALIHSYRHETEYERRTIRH